MFHVLPENSRALNYGRTVFAGEDMADRREVLARLADLYLVIEGGTGTKHETQVAASDSRSMIPVGRSGEHSAVLYKKIEKPSWADDRAWAELGRELSEPRKIAEAVVDLIHRYHCFRLASVAGLSRRRLICRSEFVYQAIGHLPQDNIERLLDSLTEEQSSLIREVFESIVDDFDDYLRSDETRVKLDAVKSWM